MQTLQALDKLINKLSIPNGDNCEILDLDKHCAQFFPPPLSDNLVSENMYLEHSDDVNQW